MSVGREDADPSFPFKNPEFFFGRFLPGSHRVVVGVIVSHQFYSVLHRDFVLFHEVANLRVYLVDFSGFHVSPPGGMSSLQEFPSSSFSRVFFMFGQVTSFFMADEALLVPRMLHPFARRKIDVINIHGIRVLGRSGGFSVLSWWDIAISPSSEFPESYHVLVELSSFVKPLLPFPNQSFPVLQGGLQQSS